MKSMFFSGNISFLYKAFWKATGIFDIFGIFYRFFKEDVL